MQEGRNALVLVLVEAAGFFCYNLIVQDRWNVERQPRPPAVVPLRPPNISASEDGSDLLCPLVPPGLVGSRLKIDLTETRKPPPWKSLSAIHREGRNALQLVLVEAAGFLCYNLAVEHGWHRLERQPRPPVAVAPLTPGILTSEVDGSRNLCPPVPPGLARRAEVNLEEMQKPLLWTHLNAMHSNVRRGGRNSPKECEARHRVAVVVPYMKREAQLRAFLHHMHPFLTRQQLDYGIYVVNQTNHNNPFNRAMLLNVGFVEAARDRSIDSWDRPWDCFVLHDVDLLPEDDRNVYACRDGEGPRHMAVARDTSGYKLPYQTFFGGVCSLTARQMRSINGLSNQFWGWGGEDDDLYNRVVAAGMNVTRRDPNVDRYTMIRHKKEKPSRDRFAALKRGKALFKTDGLNNLRYKLLGIRKHPLFTAIHVDIQPVKPLERTSKTKTKPG